MKIITICGSLKFTKEMMIEAQKYSLNGICVLTPIYPVDENIIINKKQLQFLKEEHFKKIELSDAILVLNKDNYIGESTKREIEYAKSLNKEIIYYENI
jgi:hypothetical protein